MKKPLYTFGDKVKVKIMTSVEGVLVEVKIDKVVCAIKAKSCNTPETTLLFEYGLTNDLMFQNHFMWAHESQLTKLS